MPSSDHEERAERVRRAMQRHESERTALASGEAEQGADFQLGQIALEWGLVNPDTLIDHLRKARQAKVPLESILRDAGVANEDQLRRLAEERTRRVHRFPRFKRYDLLEELGEGAMGTVYRALDRELNRHVALKVLRASSKMSEAVSRRFQREARAAAGLSHPNLVTVFDVLEEDGRMALVMELVSGEPFEARIQSGDMRECVQLLEKAARGIGAAHAGGVVHRDVKPANIMVTSRGEAKVADFGLAHILGSETAITRTGAAVGTPLYMAPEQAGGALEIGPTADVYSLGVILYQILTGRPPHEAKTLVELYRKLADERPAAPHLIRPGVPADLEAIALKALSKDPWRRYPTADAFAEDLARYLAGKPLDIRSTTITQRMMDRFRRRPLFWTVSSIAGAALSLAVVLVVVLYRGREAAQEESRLSDRARQYSAMWFDLSLKTMPAMKDLQDYRFGAKGLVDISGRVREVDEICRDVQSRFPNSKLPEAWAGLARIYANREEEGLKKMEAACRDAGEDPFPDLLMARGQVMTLLLKGYIPGVSFTDDALDQGGKVEAPGLREASDRIRESLDRVLGRTIWPRIEQGRDIAGAAEGIRLYVENRFADAARKLDRVRKESALEDELALLRGISLFLSNQLSDCVTALEGPASRFWSNGLYLRSIARIRLGLREAAQGRDALAYWNGAIADFRAYVERFPGQVGGWTGLGSSLDFRGQSLEAANQEADPDFAEALRCFDKAIELRPDFPNARNSRASLLLNHATRAAARGENPLPWVDRAMTDCDAAIASDPAYEKPRINRAAAWRERALRTRNAADAAKAFEDYDEVIRRAPNSGLALVNRSWTRSRLAPAGLGSGDLQQDLSKAVDDASRAIELLPRSTDALRARATALRNLGVVALDRGAGGAAFFDRAIEDYDRALEINPAFAECHGERGECWRLRAACESPPKDCLARAMSDFETALKAKPGNFRFLGGRGMTYLIIGEEEDRTRKNDPATFERAIADFDEAILKRPGDADYLVSRGQARLLLGRILVRLEREGTGELYLAALADFEAALTARPGWLRAVKFRGFAHFFLGEWKPAAVDFEEVLRRNPSEPGIRESLEICRKELAK